MRLLGDGLGEQTTLVEAHIARRCPDQTAHRMALHVFAHIKAQQINAHDVGQLLGSFRFSHARGAREQEGADRLVCPAKT